MFFICRYASLLHYFTLYREITALLKEPSLIFVSPGAVNKHDSPLPSNKARVLEQGFELLGAAQMDLLRGQKLKPVVVPGFFPGVNLEYGSC